MVRYLYLKRSVEDIQVLLVVFIQSPWPRCNKRDFKKKKRRSSSHCKSTIKAAARMWEHKTENLLVWYLQPIDTKSISKHSNICVVRWPWVPWHESFPTLSRLLLTRGKWCLSSSSRGSSYLVLLGVGHSMVLVDLVAKRLFEQSKLEISQDLHSSAPIIVNHTSFPAKNVVSCWFAYLCREVNKVVHTP